MRCFSTEIQGRTKTGWVQKVNGRLWVYLNGRTFIYEPESSRQRKRSQSGHTHPGQIRAPMPGKVTRVQATAGTVVPAGQVLVVLEAMKMEYALKADVRGLVKAIHVKVGEQVPLAKLLIELQVEAVGKDVE